MESLAVLVVACPRTDVDGVWQRHVAARHAARALDGRHGIRAMEHEERLPCPLSRPAHQLGHRRGLSPPCGPSRGRDHARPPRAPQSGDAWLATPICSIFAKPLAGCGSISRSMSCVRRLRSRLRPLPGGRTGGPSDRLSGIVAPAATDMGETLAVFTDVPRLLQRPARSAPDTAWDHPCRPLPCATATPSGRRQQAVTTCYPETAARRAQLAAAISSRRGGGFQPSTQADLYRRLPRQH